MPRLAKEVGLVGGHHVDQVNQLFLQALAGKQIVAVLAVGVNGEILQAPLDAHLEHGLPLGAEVDAGLVVDQLAEPRIVPG